MAGSGGAAREKGQKWHLARQPTSTQESNARVQAYEARRYGARVIWLKLDCLYLNLQKVQEHARRKDARNRRHNLYRHHEVADTPSGMWSDAQ